MWRCSSKPLLVTSLSWTEGWLGWVKKGKGYTLEESIPPWGAHLNAAVIQTYVPWVSTCARKPLLVILWSGEQASSCPSAACRATNHEHHLSASSQQYERKNRSITTYIHTYVRTYRQTELPQKWTDLVAISNYVAGQRPQILCLKQICPVIGLWWRLP